MKTLIFIHGGESFVNQEEYKKFLSETYVTWQSKAWTPEVKTSWVQEIAKKAYSQNIQVFTPIFPNKLDAKYEDWKLVFESILEQINPLDEVTLVGGSLGGCFLLKYFSELRHQRNSTPLPPLEGGLWNIQNTSLPTLEEGLRSIQKLPVSSLGERGLEPRNQVSPIFIKQIHLVAACISAGDFTTPENYDNLRKLGKKVHIWHAEDDGVVSFATIGILGDELPQAVIHAFSAERGYGHFHGIESFPELEDEILRK